MEYIITLLFLNQWFHSSKGQVYHFLEYSSSHTANVRLRLNFHKFSKTYFADYQISFYKYCIAYLKCNILIFISFLNRMFGKPVLYCENGICYWFYYVSNVVLKYFCSFSQFVGLSVLAEKWSVVILLCIYYKSAQKWDFFILVSNSKFIEIKFGDQSIKI